MCRLSEFLRYRLEYDTICEYILFELKTCQAFGFYKGSTMANKTMNLSEMKNLSADQFLRGIIQSHQSITVFDEEGHSVEIRPVGLTPLPELEGSVPKNWKDGIYAQ